MKDQAAGLRAPRLARAPFAEAPSAVSAVSAVVIGSGKGGVGKSLLAVWIAAALARRGRRVLLFDGAQNQGNLHVMLGVRPVAPLEALVAGEIAVEALVVPLGERLSLLPADSGAPALHGMTALDRSRLHHRLSALYDRYDDVVVDAGPGVENALRVAAIRARRLAVVAMPEPAALSDAYALIKLAHLQVPSLPVDLLVNRTLDANEGPAVFESLSLAARRFLCRDLGYLGAVPECEGLRRAARTPRELIEAAPSEVDGIAGRLDLGAAAAGEDSNAAATEGVTT